MFRQHYACLHEGRRNVDLAGVFSEAIMTLPSHSGLYYISLSSAKCHLSQPFSFFCSSPRSSSRAGGTHIAILARSLVYYLSVALPPKLVDQLALKIAEQTTKWISTLFR